MKPLPWSPFDTMLQDAGQRLQNYVTSNRAESAAGLATCTLIARTYVEDVFPSRASEHGLSERRTRKSIIGRTDPFCCSGITSTTKGTNDVSTQWFADDKRNRYKVDVLNGRIIKVKQMCMQWTGNDK